MHYHSESDATLFVSEIKHKYSFLYFLFTEFLYLVSKFSKIFSDKWQSAKLTIYVLSSESIISLQLIYRFHVIYFMNVLRSAHLYCKFSHRRHEKTYLKRMKIRNIILPTHLYNYLDIHDHIILFIDWVRTDHVYCSLFCFCGDYFIVSHELTYLLSIESCSLINLFQMTFPASLPSILKIPYAKENYFPSRASLFLSRVVLNSLWNKRSTFVSLKS